MNAAVVCLLEGTSSLYMALRCQVAHATQQLLNTSVCGFASLHSNHRLLKFTCMHEPVTVALAGAGRPWQPAHFENVYAAGFNSVRPASAKSSSMCSA